MNGYKIMRLEAIYESRPDFKRIIELLSQRSHTYITDIYGLRTNLSYKIEEGETSIKADQLIKFFKELQINGIGYISKNSNRKLKFISPISIKTLCLLAQKKWDKL